MLTDKQLEQRKTLVTATDIPTLLGLNPWSSPLQIYERKKGISQPYIAGDAAMWGHIKEPWVVQMYKDHHEENIKTHSSKTVELKKALTDEMGIVMKYPTIDSFTGTGITDVTAENMLDVITTCIDHIYDKKGEEIYETKDQTKKELSEFIESLNTKQFQKVQQFFDTMPKLKHAVELENPKTGVKSKIVLQGLNDFFA